MAKHSEKITWGYWPSKERHSALQSMKLSHYRWNFNKFVQHSNWYILIIHSNFSCKSDAKLTDTIEIKAFISFLCSAGELWTNKKSLQKLWGTDRDGTEKCCLVMNQRRFKFLITCILE
jgi:hypothetical protein